jgi:hypothetical protein
LLVRKGDCLRRARWNLALRTVPYASSVRFPSEPVSEASPTTASSSTSPLSFRVRSTTLAVSSTTRCTLRPASSTVSSSRRPAPSLTRPAPGSPSAQPGQPLLRPRRPPLGRLAHHLSGRAPDLSYRPDQALQDLRVLADGVEGLVEEGTYLLKPHLQEHLGLQALIVSSTLSRSTSAPTDSLDEVGQLREDRHVGPEPLYVQIDLLDLEHGHVQQHVGFVGPSSLALGLR